ncbi:MAG: hypothetical protein A3F16_01345 [Deltaproteobacteria bacterium RIFCSPHIGHO2_12_FULL_43_9]|nr:MAG: hypothetical protein A3F16_01345 [Deltaproteobacteria bacterium RIFCSPHIGHO2_12_FULL_43_9]
MSKAMSALLCSLFLILISVPAFAQDEEGLISEKQSRDQGDRYDELAAKIEKLQDKLDALVTTSERYAGENQRLKEENARLENELYLVNTELNQARNIADDTSRRFDSSVVAVDQRDQIRFDYGRRVEDFCADAWGSEDDREQCSRQQYNFGAVDSIMKSK